MRRDGKDRIHMHMQARAIECTHHCDHEAEGGGQAAGNCGLDRALAATSGREADPEVEHHLSKRASSKATQTRRVIPTDPETGQGVMLRRGKQAARTSHKGSPKAYRSCGGDRGQEGENARRLDVAAGCTSNRHICINAAASKSRRGDQGRALPVGHGRLAAACKHTPIKPHELPDEPQPGKGAARTIEQSGTAQARPANSHAHAQSRTELTRRGCPSGIPRARWPDTTWGTSFRPRSRSDFSTGTHTYDDGRQQFGWGPRDDAMLRKQLSGWE